MTKKILILPGDYIGREIMAEAVKVLEVFRTEGEKIEWSFGHLGGAAYDAEGHPYPESTQKAARAADAILMGAVGGPKYDSLPRVVRPEQGILGIRKEGDHLVVAPALPTEWEGFSAVLRPGKAVYRVRVARGAAAAVEIDGKKSQGNSFKIAEEGEFDVLVTVPAEGSVVAGTRKRLRTKAAE